MLGWARRATGRFALPPAVYLRLGHWRAKIPAGLDPRRVPEVGRAHPQAAGDASDIEGGHRPRAVGNSE